MESESCQLTRFSSHCRKIHMFFPDWFYQANARKKLQIFKYGNMICISKWFYDFMLYRRIICKLI